MFIVTDAQSIRSSSIGAACMSPLCGSKSFCLVGCYEYFVPNGTGLHTRWIAGLLFVPQRLNRIE